MCYLQNVYDGQNVFTESMFLIFANIYWHGLLWASPLRHPIIGDVSPINTKRLRPFFIFLILVLSLSIIYYYQRCVYFVKQHRSSSRPMMFANVPFSNICINALILFSQVHASYAPDRDVECDESELC